MAPRLACPALFVRASPPRRSRCRGACRLSAPSSSARPRCDLDVHGPIHLRRLGRERAFDALAGRSSTPPAPRVHNELTDELLYSYLYINRAEEPPTLYALEIPYN
eukprot:scaffold41795_cov53-Phaeocystis_antarctica.AAC.2